MSNEIVWRSNILFFSSLELHRFGDIDVLWNVLYTPLSLSRPSFITVIIEVVRRLERSRRKGGEKGPRRRVDYRYRSDSSISAIDFLLENFSRSYPFLLQYSTLYFASPDFEIGSLNGEEIREFRFPDYRGRGNFMGNFSFFLIELISITTRFLLSLFNLSVKFQNFIVLSYLYFYKQM